MPSLDSPSPTASLSRPGDPRVRRAVAGVALAAAVLGYGAHLLSPLRLNFDAVLLLRMAMAHQQGRGWNPPDVGSQHPVGYPAVVVALERAGVAGQAGFAAINLLALAAGVWASACVIRRVWPRLHMGHEGQPGGWHPAWMLAAAAPASWICVKHASLALTDVPYFGVSMGAVLAIERAWRREARWPAWLALGAALCAMALALRTIGIALLPALVLATVGADRAGGWARAALSRPLALVAGALGVLAAGVGLGAVIVRTSYWTGFAEQYGSGSLASVLGRTAEFRLLDLGQALLNIPASALPAMALPVLLAAGLAGYAMLALGLWRARGSISPAWVYFAAYSAIVAIWPFGDPRFWLPILPLAAAFAWTALPMARCAGRGRLIVALAAGGFASLGMMAMLATGRVSLSGDAFAERYSSGAYRETYRAAWGQPHDPARVQAEVLDVLRRYEPRARRSEPVPASPGREP